MIDLANDFNLEQMVTEPTRKDKILELFFTNNPSLVEKSVVIPGMSDHDGIPLLVINTSPKISKPNPCRVYVYSKADMSSIKNKINEFSEEFCDTSPSDESVESMWNRFKTHLKETMDTHISTKVVSKQNKTPWISPKVKRMHRRKQRAYNRARNTGTDSDWDYFRSVRKDTHKLTKFAYRKYIRNFCLESKKMFWSFIKNLRKDSSGIPSLKDKGVLYSEDRQKAEILNNQFRSVFTTENLESFPTSLQNNVPHVQDIRIHTHQGLRNSLRTLIQIKLLRLMIFPPNP